MSDKRLIVKCSLGSLQGSVYNTVDGDEIYSFQGIPYAKPPVGDLRFKEPVPIEPWTGVKLAVESPPKSICIPMGFYGDAAIPPGYSEDCLYLNIHTPQIPTPNLKLPVMAYIHGGGFTYGSGNVESVGPDFLVPRGVILVTINYRLGALGFLSLQTPECPGNNGLKDQNLALRWIQKNISAFGGNPDNVTLFGESAGSVSVHYHLLSKLSRGLFHRAITQSGTATNRWAYARYPKKAGLLLASKVAGKEITNPDEALKILRNAPVRDILEKSDPIFEEIEGLWAGENICKFAFVPTAEPGNTVNGFLTKHPQQAIDDGDTANVPLITGVCAHEGLFVIPRPDYVPDENNLVEFEKLLPKETGVQLGSEKAVEAAKKVIKFYFPDGKITQAGYVNVSSDTLMSYKIAKDAMVQAQKLTSPVYFYVFSAGREASALKTILGLKNIPGTSHADELEFLFTATDPMPYQPIVKGTKEEDTKNLLSQIWTDFAKDGKMPKEWKPVQNPDYDYVELTDKLIPKKGFYADVVKFWDDIYAYLTK